jgi:DnaK suppressor protein
MVGRMANPRELLLAERALAGQRVAALEREFAGIAEAASAGGTDDEHDPEGATLAFERQHVAALLERAREQLAAIEIVLERVRDGRYGLCDRCGQPIGDDRLAARPAALTCIRCAVLSGAQRDQGRAAVLACETGLVGAGQNHGPGGIRVKEPRWSWRLPPRAGARTPVRSA